MCRSKAFSWALGACLCCGLLCASAVFSAESRIEVVLYGDDSYPPYSYISNGQPEGIYCRILQVAAKRIEGYDVQIVLMPYKRVLEAARRGSVFAIFPPYYLPKQRPYLSEYSVPLYTEETVVYCGKNILISPKPNWPEDYFGLTIGNNDGFLVGGEAFHAAAKQNKLIIENAKGTDVNIRKLIADRIDCYVNDRASIVWSIKQMKKNKKLPYVREVAEGSIISQENGHVAFSKKFDARYRRDFIDKLNAIILDMQKSGDINTIVDNFLR